MNEAAHISFISTFVIIKMRQKIENGDAGYCIHCLDILLVFE